VILEEFVACIPILFCLSLSTQKVQILTCVFEFKGEMAMAEGLPWLVILEEFIACLHS
jgi:dimeric dUTPase (all-alpha-NTP-PPase superfamily)